MSDAVAIPPVAVGSGTDCLGRLVFPDLRRSVYRLRSGATRAGQGAFTWINGALLMIALAVTGLLLFWARRCWRAARQTRSGNSPSRRMILWLGGGVHLAAAIATLGVGLTVLFLPPCL